MGPRARKLDLLSISSYRQPHPLRLPGVSERWGDIGFSPSGKEAEVFLPISMGGGREFQNSTGVFFFLDNLYRGDQSLHCPKKLVFFP